MKTLLSTIALTFVVCLANAQSTPADTARFPLGDSEIWVISKTDSARHSITINDTTRSKVSKEALTYWAGLDLGVNFLLNQDRKVNFSDEESWIENDPARSLSWRFNFLEERIRLYKDYVGLTTGAGFTWNSFTFTDNTRLITNSDSTYGVIDSIPEYDKNKLRVTYLNVPLLLQFNTNTDPERNFHLSVGVIGGLRIGSRTKQTYEFNGENNRSTVVDDFNLRPVTVDATARIGYRNFVLWANYSLIPMFREDKGPTVYPVSVGVSFIPFD